MLLALCRLERIPCRYIAGMIPGEGATHAWVEIFSEGIWRMLDPTHNRECNDTYMINQGVFYGDGRQTQENKVVCRKINSQCRTQRI